LTRPLAITCGDPAGVGPDIIERWLKEHPDWSDRIVLLGPPDWLNSLSVAGIPCGHTGTLTPGAPSAEGARTAWEAMREAAQGCLDGRFSAVVTAPVGKAPLQSVGFPFPGQTEFFADAWGGSPSMAFAGRRLRVVLATWHLPLATLSTRFRAEPELLDRAVLRTLAWAGMERIRDPRIAVCGLNPHAGEGGLLGNEEKELLNPRLQVLRARAPGLSDCLPADTVFHRLLNDEFDFAVALYHDQGLIPVKTLEFHTAVNLTLGLPFVRTSPDHGTAFSIAGKGLARTGSFAHAVELAARYANSTPTG